MSPIKPTHSFAGTQPVTGWDFGGGYTGDGATNLKGTVSGLSMKGTWTLHIEVKDPQGATAATCDETATFKAAAKKARIFAGFTSQNAPVVMELNPAGTVVHHFHIGWRSSCESGRQFAYGDTLLNFDVKAGVFGDTFTQNYGEPGGKALSG